MEEILKDTNQKSNKPSFKKIGGSFDNKTVIHTMPKRFLGIKPAVQKTKGIGMIIVIGGAILMIGGFAFFYFYLFSSNEQTPKLNFNDIKTASKVEEEKKVLPKEEEAEILKEEDVKKEAETIQNDIKKITAIDITEVATSTATSTKRIEAELASSTVDVNESTKTYKSAMDGDNDGLGDLEEMLVDSNLTSSDSDGDGYDDYSELLKLYNPAGSGNLMTNSNIGKYTNNTYKYSLYYPRIWTNEKVGSDESILFKIGNNQFIQIIVQPGKVGQSIEEWYREQFNVNIIKGEQILYKAGWSGIRSEDGLVVYLSNPKDNNIYIMSYNIGLSDTASYKSIFEMMLKSLEIIHS